jgi:hypothetical protein
VSQLWVPALGFLGFHLWGSTLGVPPSGSSLGVPVVPPWGSTLAFHFAVSTLGFHLGGPALRFQPWGSWGSTLGFQLGVPLWGSHLGVLHWGSHLWFQPGFMGFHLGVPPWGSHLWVPCLRVPVALGGPTFVFQPPWRPTLGGLTLGFHPGGPTFGL